MSAFSRDPSVKRKVGGLERYGYRAWTTAKSSNDGRVLGEQDSGEEDGDRERVASQGNREKKMGPWDQDRPYAW